MSTIKITVGSTRKLAEQTRRRIDAIERGEGLDDAPAVINFESYYELGRLLSEKNLELLGAIVRHEPASIAATADLVDRDYKEVHRNLTELEAMGLITFRGGSGRQGKEPVFPHDCIEIEIPFGEENAGAGVATS